MRRLTRNLHSHVNGCHINDSNDERKVNTELRNKCASTEEQWNIQMEQVISLVGQQQRVVRHLIPVGFEPADLLVVGCVVELLKAVVAEEAWALWHQLIIACQPHGFSLTHTARVASDLSPEEHQPRVHLNIAGICPGVE